MKKYFLYEGNQQIGPLDIEDLRRKNISPATAVWHDGLDHWVSAKEVPALNVLFTPASPPPFSGFNQQQQHLQQTYVPPASGNSQNTPKKKSYAGLIISLIVLVLALSIGAIVMINNPNAVPGVELDINTPKPTVVTSRADGSGSGIFNARTTVYATVMNQGGDGNVLVTFYVYQGGNTYDRSKSIYMRAGTSQDLEVTFEEVDFISGEITYDVFARGE